MFLLASYDNEKVYEKKLRKWKMQQNKNPYRKWINDLTAFFKNKK